MSCKIFPAETGSPCSKEREVGKTNPRVRMIRAQLQRAMESSAGRRPIPHEAMIERGVECNLHISWIERLRALGGN